VRRGSKPIRALIGGGGIGGLAAAVALRNVGIDAAVFEKAPQIAEISAGVPLWSNALIVLRRLGLEARALAAGAIIDDAATVLPQGKALPGLDVAALGAKAGASTICIRRGALQHLLLEAALAAAATVETARECIGRTGDGYGCIARFADGSMERGDVPIGADGIRIRNRSPRDGRLIDRCRVGSSSAGNLNSLALKPVEMLLRFRRRVLRGGFLVEHAFDALRREVELGKRDAGVEGLAVGSNEVAREPEVRDARDQHRLALVVGHLRAKAEAERRVAERAVGH